MSSRVASHAGNEEDVFMTDVDQRLIDPAGRHSRRAALQSGALAAALAGLGAHAAAAEDATPSASAAGLRPLLVQAFSHGTLFPTQGDSPDQPPLTLILWDAADRGVVAAGAANGRAGIVPADQVLALLGDAGSSPEAALVARAAHDDNTAAGSEAVWLLSLVGGQLGSDPGAVTYQGDVLATDAAEAAFGMASSASPEGAQNLDSGFLLITGLSESAIDSDGGVWLAWP
jgi:hypothetical protein